MVKRAKSPDAAEDEKYFTVYQPYPLNANWEVDSDYIAFGRWIAACIGPEPVHGLMYKPSARGMVILEIDKKYPHNGRLLGEHRWVEFLKKPTEEESPRITQIFHCLYNTGREAQKDGWKRIHVEASWFKEWNPSDTIRDPYPVTHWCPVPAEDKTNKALCRPLPVAVKPPPPRVIPPVVGSANWAKAKAEPSQNTPEALKGAWGKGTTVPGSQAPVKTAAGSGPSTSNAWAQPILTAQPSKKNKKKKASSTSPSSPMSPTTQNAPLSPANIRTSASTSPTSPTGPTPARAPNASTGAWGNARPAGGPTAQYQTPPGLDPRNPASYPLVPPGLTRRPQSANPSDSGSGLSSNPKVSGAGGIGTAEEPGMFPSQVYKSPIDEPMDPNTDVVHPWEEEFVESVENLWATTSGSNEGNLWGDSEPVAKKPTGPLCPTHHVLCKKGICSDYAKLIKKIEREKAMEERSAKKGGKGKGSGGWRAQKDSGEDASVDDDGFSSVGRKGRRHAPSSVAQSTVGGSDDTRSENGWANADLWT